MQHLAAQDVNTVGYASNIIEPSRYRRYGPVAGLRGYPSRYALGR